VLLMLISISASVCIVLCLICHGMTIIRNQAKLQEYSTQVEKPEEPTELDELALSALMKLGYKKSKATEALEKAMQIDKSATTEVLVKRALRYL